ncbi:MAG: DNA ligase D [Solirubrobacteraceae bacterium]|nr:DNA ligase D [Solirubrobacteraceae bacterium]
MAKSDRLEPYRGKRDAGATPEPDGTPPATDGHDGEPRFVVQEHHATRLHWDLRLEHDGVLLSWALPNGVPATPKENRLAVRTEDHPLEYLEFHGEIPEGQYGAGTMTIYDQGTFEAHKIDDDKVEITFHGERLDGRYGLFPLKRDGGPRHEWMIHRMDPPADAERAPMPQKLAPMLAKPGTLPPDAEKWAYEVKWDGVRALAYGQPGRLTLHSRNQLDITGGYPELRALRNALGHHEVILDGEIVAFDAEGKPSFERLQKRMHVRGDAQVRRLMKDVPVVYVLFDLLWLDGHSLMERSYDERRAALEGLGLQSRHWQTLEPVEDGEALLAATREQGLEGIVAKRRDFRYEAGRRSASWIKITNLQREDVVIAGWLPGEGRRSKGIGSLVVAVEGDGGHLRYAGRVGTGFTEAELDRLTKQLSELQTDQGAIEDERIPKEVTWVRPELTAAVEFRHWTKDGVLRAPSYKGLRPDASPTAGILDVGRPVRNGVEVQVEDHTLKITNLDKVLYPAAGFAKRDVIAYLVDVAPVLLPHLEGRPLTRKRYPDGVDGKAFFEKNAPSHTPDWVRTFAVPGGREGTVTYVVADDLPTLVWLGNLAALELHTALHRADSPDHPDSLVFDLDPGPPATIVECCQVAMLLHGMLEGLGLRTVAKTSGSKGLQVYLPLNAGEATYDQTKTLARTIAEVLEQAEPDLVVSRMTKSLRPGKVLIDWSQNDRNKTTVNVYSLRAREQPTVSTPVTWDEVRACAEAGDPELLVFTARDVLARVAEQGDLFADVRSLVQAVPSLS